MKESGEMKRRLLLAIFLVFFVFFFFNFFIIIFILGCNFVSKNKFVILFLN